MCRIFGFRSVIMSQVHRSLMSADNALSSQSREHPDGWGVAYYAGGAPHVIKSAQAALNDSLFQKVSGVVSSETVLAHVRKSTQGDNTLLNTHPFQFGRWTFIHNGHIPNFEKYKPDLEKVILPKFRRFVLGDTDSEIIFFVILSYLQGHTDIEKRGISIDDLANACKKANEKMTEIVGAFSDEDVEGDLSRFYLTYVLTDGETMIAHQGGKELNYSTYKTQCADRDSCPSYAYECENKTATGYVNHLIFTSEPLSGENIWIPMTSGDLVGVDWSMKLSHYT
ncbi:MAG: class II glutamine amidotransferase [Pseudomonadota bacterium]